MKSIHPSRLLLPTLLAGLTLAFAPSVRSELYTGKVRLRGETQNEAKPGSISFTLKGQLTGKRSGDKANVTGGGLFRSTTDAIVDTTFTGKLTTNMRLTSRVGSPGALVRSKDTVTVRVTRRYVIFPGGRIRLDKPFDGSIDAKQRIAGTGTLQLRD